LRQARSLFEKIYEHSPDAIIVVDEVGKIDRVNVPTETLFGFPRERMLGQPIEMLIPQRFRDRHVAHRVRYMKDAKARPMGTDLQLWARRADGSEFPVDIMLSPLEIGRRRLVLAVVRDITAHRRSEEERRRSEEQVRRLMREVDHRAKNILSVVQAMARRTLSSSYQEFISRFSERIQALSASHDLLVKSEWKSVLIAELVRSQLAHFGDLLGNRITVHGPDLRITAAAAQAVGLALHELATNAGKYGALSTDTGHVDVCWQLDGDLFTMNWTERGGPPVKPPERHGFGAMVIDSMVQQSLGGEIHLDFAPTGLTWRVTCPAASVQNLTTKSGKPAHIDQLLTNEIRAKKPRRRRSP
jgi:PAS domain S-box-containing protein